MTSGVAEVAEPATLVEHRTTERPCMLCLTTLPLDDDRPKLGTVRWEISQCFGRKRGKAVDFECPQGHKSKDDPDLLRAFPSRTF